MKNETLLNSEKTKVAKITAAITKIHKAYTLLNEATILMREAEEPDLQTVVRKYTADIDDLHVQFARRRNDILEGRRR